MPLDRIITIEYPSISRDTFGSELRTWATLDQVWADKIPATGKERFVPGSNVQLATRAATWRIHYQPGITEVMRVVDDEQRVWGIIGLAVVGFNRYLDLICQSDGTRLPEPEPDSEAKGAQEELQEKQELPKPTRAE